MAFSLANENNTGESTANPKTGTIDTGALGTNTQLIVVYVITNLPRSGFDAAPTLGGDSMSQAGTVESTTDGAIEMWYLIDTFTEGRSLAISVPNNSSRTMSLLSSSWILPASKVAIFDDDNQASSINSTNPTVSVSFGLQPSIVISGLLTGANDISSLTAGRILLGLYDTGNEGQGHQYVIPNKDNDTIPMNWNFLITASFSTIGASFREVAGSGGDLSMDTVDFADMVLVNGVSMSTIVSINEVLTGN